MPSSVLVVSLGLLALALILTGCGSDAQRIREVNEISATPVPTDTPLSAEIRVIEIQEGDCVNSTLPEGISIDTVVIVPCSGIWQYRVLNSFDVADSEDYPATTLFDQQASESCDRRTTAFLFPSVASWGLSDRTVICFQAAPTPTAAPATTLTATATPPPAPTSSPTATDTPTPAVTPVTQLSAAEVYELVSPSIPFIETATGTGSGVLIEGGYVVTNYHVVWPNEAVWVVFPDGTELQDVPVVGWDSMADLAVLGPVDVSARPLKLEDGEGVSPGSELFLVGYPAEVEVFPEPTITRGILSRFREWERLGMTYLQTDAAIAGGHSGGAMLNSQGEVIGIITFSFSEAGFGLAASAADSAPIVERLIQGEFTSGLGDRRLPAGGVAFEFYVELANFWDARAFALDATAGTILQAQIDGPGDGLFQVSGPLGLLLEVDDGETGIESGAVELPVDGIHFVQVALASGESSTFDLTSTIRLKPFHDPDDGRTIAVGETVAGNIDFYSDWDWYSIRLEEGETVTISTDSINVDTLLYVDFPNSRDDQVVSDDDSGGGLFGINSELVYRAPNTGEYFIAVTDAVGDSFGGYYLSVE